MPRTARRDWPGAFHHVWSRGIERRSIFVDDVDRRFFVDQLERLVLECGIHCYAWVLMPNHLHLALQVGLGRLSEFMARLGTLYAVYFNRRHHRVGTCSRTASSHGSSSMRSIYADSLPTSMRTRFARGWSAPRKGSPRSHGAATAPGSAHASRMPSRAGGGSRRFWTSARATSHPSSGRISSVRWRRIRSATAHSGACPPATLMPGCARCSWSSTSRRARSRRSSTILRRCVACSRPSRRRASPHVPSHGCSGCPMRHSPGAVRPCSTGAMRLGSVRGE